MSTDNNAGEISGFLVGIFGFLVGIAVATVFATFINDAPISSVHIEQAEKICESNQGLKEIQRHGSFNRFNITCNDTAQFFKDMTSGSNP